MAGAKKMRFSCLTAEQQAEFDSWNKNQQNYALYRAQGMDKANSYRCAGYKCKGQASQNGYILENKSKPLMAGIIEALSRQYQKLDVLKANSEYSKKIDEKAKQARTEIDLVLHKVPMDSPYKETEPISPDKLTAEQANDIAFYREIANGNIKSVTITKRYDKEHNLIEERVVEESSVETRMKAQKEIMRKCGISDMLELGSVTANSINVLIVDASKEKEQVDTRDTIKGELKEIDGELALVTEKEDG